VVEKKENFFSTSAATIRRTGRKEACARLHSQCTGFARQRLCRWSKIGLTDLQVC
jgi:hypothetical protein